MREIKVELVPIRPDFVQCPQIIIETIFDGSINKDSKTCLIHDNNTVVVFLNWFQKTVFG